MINNIEKISFKKVVLLLIPLMAFSLVLTITFFSQGISTFDEREEYIGRIRKNAVISSETKVENYIISGFDSSNGGYGLVVFAPKSGAYKFQSCVYSDSKDYITLPLSIGNNHYLIIWYKNADSDSATIKFFDDNKKVVDCIESDLSSRKIIVCDNVPKSFSLEADFHNKFVKAKEAI